MQESYSLKRGTSSRLDRQRSFPHPRPCSLYESNQTYEIGLSYPDLIYLSLTSLVLNVIAAANHLGLVFDSLIEKEEVRFEIVMRSDFD